MRKRFNLISTIMCIALCACMITFGVYAATKTSASFTSSVSFSPTNLKVKVMGLIANSKNEQDSTAKLNYYACNVGSTENPKQNISSSGDADTFGAWQFGNITAKDNASGNPGEITFYIQISNYVETKVRFTLVATYDAGVIVSATQKTVTNAQATTANGFFNQTATTAPTVGTIPTVSGASAITPTVEGNKSTITINPNSSTNYYTTTILVVTVGADPAYIDSGLPSADFDFTLKMESINE